MYLNGCLPRWHCIGTNSQQATPSDIRAQLTYRPISILADFTLTAKLAPSNKHKMCQTENKVYTVCTHVYQEVVPCTLSSRTRVRCANPEVITAARFGFCRACRDYYKPLATDCPYFILTYWAYKAERGVNCAVHPSYVPHGELMWVSSNPVEEYRKRVHSPRNDLSTLAKVLPRFKGETRDEYVERLQFIRHATLEWAGRRRKGRTSDEKVVYPPPESFGPPESSGSSSAPPTPPKESVTVRDTPQVHDETLARLCGTWKGISSEHMTDPEREVRWRQVSVEVDQAIDDIFQGFAELARSPQPTSRFSFD
ncbi:hypothetical protein B0T21DRAFT_372827 [Apiosordaria backusii]|uniref:Uncharacterized protein n=1 Tax=Apiosordaria backusii TaxID=314023 RepID=A0AA40E667_9PEZI|nr:hypothetical protein B0T21DRAFT_372827 [Apiosordaria backusii]